MVRNFKGQVKIADVQAEFDSLLNKINGAIDKYNNAAQIEDIDYNNGSPELGANGYSLSVGGLKSVINAYNGVTLGCQVYKIDDTTMIITDGLHFADGRVLRMPSRKISGEGDIIYFSESLNTYSTSNTGGTATATYKSWSQPSNTTIDNSATGQLSITENIQREPNGVGKMNAYECFPTNSYAGCIPSGSADGKFGTLTLTWNFPKKLRLERISFKWGTYKMAGKVEVKDLNNNILLSTTKTSAIDDAIFNQAFSTGNTMYAGIKIVVTPTQTISNIDFPVYVMANPVRLGNVQLTASTKSVTYIGDADDWIEVARINQNREAILLNKINAVNEGVDGIKMTIKDRNPAFTTNEALNNTKKGQFVCAIEPIAEQGRNAYEARLFGTKVSRNFRDRAGRAKKYWIPTNYLFIPKGISNPYTYHRVTEEDDYVVDGYNKIFDYNLKNLTFTDD